MSISSSSFDNPPIPLTTSTTSAALPSGFAAESESNHSSSSHPELVEARTTEATLPVFSMSCLEDMEFLERIDVSRLAVSKAQTLTITLSPPLSSFAHSTTTSFFSPIHMYMHKAVVDPAMPRISEDEIVIAGEILDDGLGDFFNMMAVIEEITDAYPGQKIRLIVHIDDAHFTKIYPLLRCPPNVTLDVLKYPLPLTCGESEETIRRIGEGQKVRLPGELEEAVKRAFYSIEYYTSARSSFILPSPTFAFAEPGWGKSTLSHTESLGICIRSRKEEEHSLSELSHPWLKEVLPAVYCPSKALLSFAYFSDLGNSKLHDFIYLVASETSSESELVIVSNTPSLEIYRALLAPALSAYGFSEIIIKSPSSTDQIIPISTTGSRKIYILDPFPLTPKDFAILRACSTTKIIGCTGDKSLCDVLQDLRHVPFYQLREHKIAFWEDFILFAKGKLGDHHPYVRYVKLILRNMELTQAGYSPRKSDLLTSICHTLSPGHDAMSMKHDEMSIKYKEMISTMKEDDFVSGARRVHAALLAEKSLPKHILAQIEIDILPSLKGKDS